MKHKQIIFMLIATFFALLYGAHLKMALGAIKLAQSELIFKIVLFVPKMYFLKLMATSLLLLLIPAVIAFIPAFIYWFFKRESLPYIMPLILILWIILLTLFFV